MTTHDPRRPLGLRATLRRDLHGHAWTLGGFALGLMRPPAPPRSRPWTTTLVEPGRGTVELSGRLAETGSERAIALLVHGLGGDAESIYLRRAARAAAAAGMATLRLALRGADGSGADVYHAGIADDVRAALRSPELARFEHVVLVGYSLGGHVVLTTARDVSLDGRPRAALDVRVRAVAAICPPLDLEATVDAIRRLDRRHYERHVLGSLVRQHDAVAARAEREGRAIPSRAADVRRVRTIREWDERVVCPRYGHPDAHTYYERVSVGPHLGALARPALVVVADADPMVPLDTVLPAIERARGAPNLTVARLSRGGHVAYPADLRVENGPAGVEESVIAWLARAVTT